MTLKGEKLTGWNYRVVRRNVDDEIEYGIHEMYYDPDGWTADPVPVSAESVEALRWTLNKMLLALECEVIDGTPSEESTQVEGHTHLWPDSGAGLRDRADTACTVCGKRWVEAKSTQEVEG